MPISENGENVLSFRIAVKLIKKQMFKKIISQPVKIANNIVDRVLGDLRNEVIPEENLKYVTPDGVIPRVLKNYVFQSEEERSKVKFSDNLLEIIKAYPDGTLRDEKAITFDRDNFIFRVEENRFSLVLCNLLKNSLRYLSQFPQAIVTIGIEKNKEYKGCQYNAIYVHDSGPGIPKNVIDNLCRDFYKSGKKGGSDLGLSICKKNMNILGGHIICESEFDKSESSWTKFSLLFPILSKDQLKRAQEPLNEDARNHKEKILIVDDEKVNLIVTKRKIEKNLNFICDTSVNGKEAMELCKKNDYKLILMDIQMPVMSGIESSKRIREFNKDVPIIALTSLEYEELEEGDGKYFNSYLTKPAGGHILHRTIAKHTNYKDDLDYLGGEDQYLSELKGKNIILADDQEMNRSVTAKKLSSLGANVTEVIDGYELVKLYEESIVIIEDENGKRIKKSKFDIIL